MVALLPDPITVACAWAKADPDISAIVGTWVASRIPKDAQYPFLRVQNVGGGGDTSQIPGIGVYLLQWDAFAVSGDDRNVPNLPAASALARTVAAKAQLVQFAPVVVAGAMLGALNVIVGPQPVEDETGKARFRLDTEIWIKIP